MTDISIINYGAGNVGSIANMFRHIGVKARIASTPSELVGSSAVVLPGVGAFDHVIQQFRQRGFEEPVKEMITAGTPVLAICVGMQILCEGSEEGELEGVGLFKGKCRRLKPFTYGGRDFKVPHIGWADLSMKDSHPAFKSFTGIPRFYFVHSYYMDCESQNDIVALADYGLEFPCVVARKNVLACQFHPEKSHRFGIQLFKGFVSWIES